MDAHYPYDPEDHHQAQRHYAMRDCRQPEEFEVAGTAVAAALTAGLSVEVSIAPGNGTRYAFLFVPVDAETQYASPREHLESAGVGETGGIWIAHLNGDGGGSVYPLALVGRRTPPDPTYINEKWFPRRQLSDDVFVLERLLWEVGNRTVPIGEVVE